MTVNHGVLGSSPCSGADARGLRKVLSKRLQGAAEERGGLKGPVSRNGIPESSPDGDPRRDPLNGKRSLKIGRFLCSPKPFLRELSSVGSERLPYKQRVGGSNPSAPTVFPARGGEGRKEKRGESREKDAESKAPGKEEHRKEASGKRVAESKAQEGDENTPFFEKKDILISSGA